MTEMQPVALVTGASSGIGAELAALFARDGHTVALVARSRTGLEAVATRIETETGRRPHVFPTDLVQPDASDGLAAALTEAGLEPAFVVNCAGVGLVGPATQLSRQEQLGMIDLNNRALTDLSLRWVDSLAAHGGGLLNVASVAGFLPGPGMAVYYATKAYVLSFTQALHQELRARGVRVTVLCPGPVPTKFQARAGLNEPPVASLFEHSVRHVARSGYDGLLAGRRIVVPGPTNKLLQYLVPFVPTSWLLTGADARQRRRKRRGPLPSTGQS